MKANKWYPEYDEMLWGYFFIDRDKTKLIKFSILLEKQGYHIVEIWQDDESLYWLSIERVEKHSIDSLLERNIDLEKFAISNEIDCYDGWDVEKILR
jgi:hypothetical protein